MTRIPSPDEVVERARRANDERIESVRALAHSRQAVADAAAEGSERVAAVQREVAESIAAAEARDVAAFDAALSAGWTAPELRKLGLNEPAKKARVARTRRRSARTTTGAEQAAPDTIEQQSSAPTE